MTPEQQLGLAVLGAAAVIAVLASPWSPLPGAQAPSDEAAGNVIWRQGYPAGHQHLCKPGDIAGGPMAGPHHLYRRPAEVGQNRNWLIQQGWDWMLYPPGEAPL